MKNHTVLLLTLIVLAGIVHWVVEPLLGNQLVFLIVKIALHTALIVAGGRYLALQTVAFYKKTTYAGTVAGVIFLAVCAALPELVATLTASFSGELLLPLHIIVGANITSLLLVGGGSILLAYLALSKSVLTHEIPYYILTIGLFAGMLAFPSAGEMYISRSEGLLLILFGVAFVWYHRTKVTSTLHDLASQQYAFENVSRLGVIVSVIALLLGGMLIIPDAALLIQMVGLSQYLVGTALVALSTTLPELVIAYTAARKNIESLALGSVIGSNMIALLLVTGITSLIKPLHSSGVIYRDIGYLFVCTLLMFLVVLFSHRREIYHVSGFLLVGLYVCYVIFLIHR